MAFSPFRHARDHKDPTQHSHMHQTRPWLSYIQTETWWVSKNSQKDTQKANENWFRSWSLVKTFAWRKDDRRPCWLKVVVHHAWTAFSELSARGRTPPCLLWGFPTLCLTLFGKCPWAWLTLDVTFDIVSWKCSLLVPHRIMKHCARSFTIGPCCHTW